MDAPAAGSLPPGLEFPLIWDGKIIARDRDGVDTDLRQALRAFGLDVPVTRGTVSAKGRYVTYKVTLTFADRASMTRITYALSQVTGVKLVL